MVQNYADYGEILKYTMKYTEQIHKIQRLT